MRSRTAPCREPVELPDVDPGLQLLETDVRGALPALVVDQVLCPGGERSGRAGGRALWADANGHARTRAVADVAPDRRVLRRVEVARGFTAYQHYAIVDAIAERALRAAGDGDRDGDPIDDPAAARAADRASAAAAREAAIRTREAVSVLVAPAIDAPYREDGLRGEEGRRMLVRALARLAGVARRLEVPVLVTRAADDALSAPVANAADGTITCERTPMGPRFASEDFETLVYPAGDGLVQTTLSFWRRVLERRAPEWVDESGTAAVDASPSPTPGDAGTLRPEASPTGQPAASDRPALVRGEPVTAGSKPARAATGGSSTAAADEERR